MLTAEQILAGRSDSYYSVYGLFDSFAESGTGNSLIALPVDAWAGVADIKYEGSGGFAMCTVDASGSVINNYIDVTSSYSGQRAYGLDSLDFYSSDENGGSPRTAALLVEAEGSWSMTVSSVADAPFRTPPFAGAGDYVYWQEGDDKVVRVQNQGEGLFELVQYYDYVVPKVHVQTEGNFDGEVAMPGGWMLVTIKSDGQWSLQ